MDVQRIEEIAQAEMAGLRCDSREPGWILYHGQRTGKLAVLLAGKLNCQVDCDILYTAGHFHDIGKGNDLHNEVGANLIQLNHGLDLK
jgi:HD superfamily phosphodiesterase